MLIPSELRYSNDHEWAKADGDVIRIGITDYAQDALGDVVFVDLPKAERVLQDPLRRAKRGNAACHTALNISPLLKRESIAKIFIACCPRGEILGSTPCGRF